MKWIIASDHAGFELKQKLVEQFPELEFQDLGPNSTESVNYADYAHQLATMIEHGEADRGVLICGSGVGVSITANRHAGVRAALCWQTEIARLCRQHNDSNVMCLPARFISIEPHFSRKMKTEKPFLRQPPFQKFSDETDHYCPRRI
jgi:ribose 5-phosphate isomerase B